MNLEAVHSSMVNCVLLPLVEERTWWLAVLARMTWVPPLLEQKNSTQAQLSLSSGPLFIGTFLSILSVGGMASWVQYVVPCLSQ